MNKNEFIRTLSPDLKKRYPTFERYQSIACDALYEFDRVCRLNGLQYFLAWGTLLGAIRDHGPIPWDYDADVFIKYSERDKVLNALQRELSPDFYCDCPQTNPNASNLFLRISKKGFSSKEIHLDIFFLVDTCDDEVKRKEQAAGIHKISMARMYRNINPFLAARGDLLLFAKALFRKVTNLCWTNTKTKKEYEIVCSLYVAETTNHYICGDRESINHVFDASIFEDVVDVEFDTKLLMAPIGYKRLLHQLYGDYDAYPSSDQQIKEYTRSLRKFEAYEKRNR